jgi:hypothetical protein
MDNGDLFIKDTIEAVYKMGIPEADKQRIFGKMPRGLEPIRGLDEDGHN